MPIELGSLIVQGIDDDGVDRHHLTGLGDALQGIGEQDGAKPHTLVGFGNSEPPKEDHGDRISWQSPSESLGECSGLQATSAEAVVADHLPWRIGWRGYKYSADPSHDVLAGIAVKVLGERIFAAVEGFPVVLFAERSDDEFQADGSLPLDAFFVFGDGLLEFGAGLGRIFESVQKHLPIGVI